MSHSLTKLTFGDLIRQHRVSAELSLNDLASLTNVSKGTISKIENGEVKKPEFKTIRTLAEALNIPYDTYIEMYIELERNPEVLHTMLDDAITSCKSILLIDKIATKYLESDRADSYEAAERLFHTTSCIQDSSTKLMLYNRIVDYSRSHGIMQFIAKGLLQKYLIERNDFSKLKETYQLGRSTLDYINFLSEKEKTTYFYALGIHAFSLLNFREAISLMERIVLNEFSESVYKTTALFNMCNSYYYLGQYDASQSYLNEYSALSHPDVEENVRILNALLCGKRDTTEGIKHLQRYIKNKPLDYYIIFAVTELMELYLIDKDYSAAFDLLSYEGPMKKALNDERTTPFKIATFAHFYKLAGNLYINNDPNTACKYYLNSVSAYAGIGDIERVFLVMANITELLTSDIELNQETRNKINEVIKSIGRIG
ncbi:helix-turn-helix transcriptional regulator [Paenibacillus assamensis]|uniref:helix-turn-helix transcriptional regulator n=1 Tax=Paenibacillus assamensis TaxID=311244 RepID=UPI00040EAFD5|nr:helix-turn-helix transcriptional regulator [Paenibacillus assamensis]